MLWRLNPSRWIADDVPYHPHYDELDRVALSVSHTKQALYASLARRLALVLPARQLPEALREHCHIGDMPQWLLALAASKYGVIYFLSRSEARSARQLVKGREDLVDRMGDFLITSGLLNELYTAAIEEYVGASHHTVVRGYGVIPPNCFMTVDELTLMVRPEDFLPDSDSSPARPEYDLHDLAHASAAHLCPELYGAKFAQALPDLPIYAEELIRSPGFESGAGPAYGDRLLFSELLMGLFDEIDPKPISVDAKIEFMANAAANYLMGEKALFHPSTRRTIRSRRAIRPEELAILAQVKAYELTASEIEQQVFVRGGTADPLAELSTSERILEMGSEEFPLIYNERRNLYKHRAHARAYLLVCQRLRDAGPESPLLHAIERNLTYKDYREGRRQNLFGLVDANRLDPELSQVA